MSKQTTLSIEDEVLGNIRRQILGAVGSAAPGVVHDLNLPAEFLAKIADRVIEASFRARHRIVVGDREVVTPPQAAFPSLQLPEWLTVQPAQPALHSEWVESRPEVRGFRAGILDSDSWPTVLQQSNPQSARASQLVAKRLALDGLVKTSRAALKELGLSGTAAANERALREVGIPTDLLQRVESAESIDVARFDEQSFHALAESGVTDVRVIRVQFAGPGYYAGMGDGGTLDIVRQLVESCAFTTFIASVEEQHLQSVQSFMAAWKPAAGTRVKLIPERNPVSQWAQDNCKAGFISTHRLQSSATLESRTPVLLAPRWAGRGEDGGVFIPGESTLMRSLPAAGVQVMQSALLFEGGNLMVVEEPSGRRVLLLGEAEVARNMALGLSRNQVHAQFLSQFQASHAVVLPAASFHIDLEVSPRLYQGQIHALVLDTRAAVVLICKLAVSKLVSVGLLSSASASQLHDDSIDSFQRVLLPIFQLQRVAPGHYPLKFSQLFRANGVDSGVGNLQRILYALDWIAAHGTPPADAARDRHFAAYLRSIRRADANRALLHTQIAHLGWQIVPVPGISADEVSLNPINGIQDRNRYLMPAYGGFFQALDDHALAVVRGAFGAGVTIESILTGETQRRGGGLHCAVCAMHGSM